MAEVHIVDIDGEQWDIKDLPLTQRVAILEEKATLKEFEKTQAPWDITGYKKNGNAQIVVALTPTSPISGKSINISEALPDGWRPNVACRIAFIDNSTDTPIGQAIVSTSGNISFYVNQNASFTVNHVYFANFSYIINE